MSREAEVGIADVLRCERQQDARRVPPCATALAGEQVEQEEERRLAAARQPDVACRERPAIRRSQRLGHCRAKPEVACRGPSSCPRTGRTAPGSAAISRSRAGTRARRPRCGPGCRRPACAGFRRRRARGAAEVVHEFERARLSRHALAESRREPPHVDSLPFTGFAYGTAMGAIRAIIFDLDNTLWDCLPRHRARRARAATTSCARAIPRVTERHDVDVDAGVRAQIALEHPAMRHDFTWLRLEVVAPARAGSRISRDDGRGGIRGVLSRAQRGRAVRRRAPGAGPSRAARTGCLRSATATRTCARSGWTATSRPRWRRAKRACSSRIRGYSTSCCNVPAWSPWMSHTSATTGGGRRGCARGGRPAGVAESRRRRLANAITCARASRSRRLDELPGGPRTATAARVLRVPGNRDSSEFRAEIRSVPFRVANSCECPPCSCTGIGQQQGARSVRSGPQNAHETPCSGASAADSFRRIGNARGDRELVSRRGRWLPMQRRARGMNDGPDDRRAQPARVLPGRGARRARAPERGRRGPHRALRGQPAHDVRAVGGAVRRHPGGAAAQAARA